MTITTKMREATGGAYESRGKFYARVTMAAQDRRGVLLPWCATLDAAKVRAVALQGMVNLLRQASQAEWIEKVIEIGGPADVEKLSALERHVAGIVEGKIERRDPADEKPENSFEHFALRWVRGELAVLYPDHVERKRSAATDLHYLSRYVFPVVGSKPIARVTLEDYEQVMREIPQRATMLRTQSKGARPRRPEEEARAKAATERRKLKSGTRRHIAQVFSRVMQLAEYPAKLVTRNPIPANAKPRAKTTIALQFLYPDEDASLMACARVDLGRRVLYGFLDRMGWRKEEALGGKVEDVEDAVSDDSEALSDIPPLTWSRVDLRRGVAFIDRDKTNDPRPMPLDEGVWRSLEAWRELHPNAKPSDPIFVDGEGTPIDPEDLVDTFRDDLHLAEVAREELFQRSAVRQPIRVHDLRASFVTVAFANHRGDQWVRDRTGHKSNALDRYRRVARTFEELNLGDWRPLDEAIPEFCSRVRGGKRGGKGHTSGGRNTEKRNDNERGDRRGSNPRQLDPQSSALPAELRPPNEATRKIAVPAALARSLAGFHVTRHERAAARAARATSG